MRSDAAADAVVGEIGPGLCVLVGVTHGDDEAVAARMADKLWRLRVFDDADGVMNLAARRHGRGRVGGEPVHPLRRHRARAAAPRTCDAARPEQAEPLIDRLVAELRALGATVATGRFRADMAVELVNDGPVTVMRRALRRAPRLPPDVPPHRPAPPSHPYGLGKFGSVGRRHLLQLGGCTASRRTSPPSAPARTRWSSSCRSVPTSWSRWPTGSRGVVVDALDQAAADGPTRRRAGAPDARGLRPPVPPRGLRRPAPPHLLLPQSPSSARPTPKVAATSCPSTSRTCPDCFDAPPGARCCVARPPRPTAMASSRSAPTPTTVARFLGEIPVFLEVNPNMPRTFGENNIHVSQIAGWCESDEPAARGPPARGHRPRPADRRAGRRAHHRPRHHPGRHRRCPERAARPAHRAPATSGSTPSC